MASVLAVAPAAYNPDLTVPFHGTRNVHTLGWTFHPRTHGPSLAAITLVTALTVVAGAFAMMPTDLYDGESKKRMQGASAHSFNPTDTMDVLLASSGGDLGKVLSELDRDYDQDNHDFDERLKIVLGMTESGRPALRTMTRP